MERADFNGFLLVPGTFIVFVWDIIQNNGTLFKYLTETIRAVGHGLIY